MSRCIQLISKAKQELVQIVKVQNLGPVKDFLGVEITKRTGSFVLSKSQYIERNLLKQDMKESLLVSTSMDPSSYMEITKNVKLIAEELGKMKGVPHCEAIGQLFYLASHTRPDIAVAVDTMSRQVSDPRSIHWAGVKKVLRYLRGT